MTPDRHVLVDRERRAYLADAVLALPERLRAVVIGYCYQERPMLEIAAELGVTESRVSQLRAEALIMLRDGLNAHLDPDTLPAEPRPDSRWPAGGPPTMRPLPPAPTSGPGWTRPRGPCSSGPPRTLGGAGSGLNPRSGNGFT